VVALYHHGLVFDRADIGRFLKTQMEMCWNGDPANPKWARVDGSTSDKYMVGSYVCPALAPFSDKLAGFIYAGPGQQERIDKAAHSWGGGVLAMGWITGKHVDLPAAKGGQPMYPQAGVRFLVKQENRDLLKSLQFAVAGAGYTPPRTPSAMKNMPRERK
jgi:hypothetical protein